MPGYEPYIVTKMEKLVTNRVDEILVVSAGEIGPTNGALKKDITHLGQPIRGRIKDDVPWGMSRTMDHLQSAFAHIDVISRLQPLIRTEGRHGWKTKGGALAGQAMQQEIIILMGAEDGDLELLRQGCRGTNMVEMAMGQKNFFQRDPGMTNQVNQAFRFPAWVDDDCRVGLTAPE